MEWVRSASSRASSLDSAPSEVSVWGDTRHSGWLWKEADGLFGGDFKPRYFVLEKTVMRYYEQQPAVDGRGLVLRTESGSDLARGGPALFRGARTRGPGSTFTTKRVRPPLTSAQPSWNGAQH